MAAPKGNNFWERRSRHGRKKLFETPELMWAAACEYFQWCVDNPLESGEVVKSGALAGKLLKVPKMRAFTMAGLCFYLNTNEAYFRTFKAQLKDGDQDFNTVISDIEATVYNQKFEGAAAGLLNANIIARDLGLSDKVENTVVGKTNLIIDLTSDEEGQS